MMLLNLPEYSIYDAAYDPVISSDDFAPAYRDRPKRYGFVLMHSDLARDPECCKELRELLSAYCYRTTEGRNQ